MNETSFKAITAGSFAGGQLSLWAVDSNGNLWGQWKTSADPGAGWSGWQKQTTPVPLQKIAVAHLADGRLEMWAIDRAGALWTQKQPSSDPSSGWGPWQQIIAQTPLQGGTVAALSDGRLELWVSDATAHSGPRRRTAPTSSPPGRVGARLALRLH